MRRRTGLVLGPVLFAAVLLLPRPEILTPEAHGAAATVVLMAAWWITEAIPIAGTALLPVVLFPLLGVADPGTVTGAYANPVIFLFLGGFLIAIAMERWGLHRRLALRVVGLLGATPRRILLGFMLSSALLSMWISNTAAAMMMVTIAMAVLASMGPGPAGSGAPFPRALMLAIAYSCSLGGVMTIIGSPPNAILVGILSRAHGIEVSFVDWMMIGIPAGTAMLAILWLVVSRIAVRGPISTSGADLAGAIGDQVMTLGPMTRDERGVAVVFAAVAVSWIARGLVDLPLAVAIDDSTIAIAGAIALFVWPSAGQRGRFLLDGESLKRVPWDIIILFGGGFALAQGVADSGLTGYIAERFSALRDLPPLVIVGAVAATVVFLTEVTSNTATASLLIPVAGALAAAVAMRPQDLMLVTALAASFAFMLPVATPPNAIAYGSRMLTIPFMARTGLALNVAGVLVLVALVALLPWLGGWPD